MALEQKDRTEYGPSWWDVERRVDDVETRHDCQVVVTLLCTREKGRGITGWTVYAKAHERKKLSAQALQCGTAALRGNRGAKTLPAALYQALLELDEKLQDEGGQAKLPGF